MKNETPPIPSGFEPHFRKSPLTDPWEPLYSRKTGSEIVLGLVADEQHTNARGFVHGGLISALADNAMGLSCALPRQGVGSLERDQVKWNPVNRPIARPTTNLGHDHVSRKHDHALVTVNLNVDFMGVARRGQWLTFETTFVKSGRSLDFAQCFVTADGVACARANATFRALKND